MNKVVIVFFWCLFSITLNAQVQLETNEYTSRSFIPASPSASSFGIFGSIPVSNYTGTPQISIPLYEISYKDIAIDLTLRYHQAIGNKPEAFPGYTGNGWLLNMGGVITRTSRGMTSYSYPSGVIIPENFNPTESSTWSSNEAMQDHLSSQNTFFSDDGRYDEYSYSFGNNVGSFFTDHNESVKIKSADGEDLLIEKTVVEFEDFTLPPEEQQPLTMLGQGSISVAYTNIQWHRNFIYKFVITDSKGIKYTFGGTDNSIEFTRPGLKANEFEPSTGSTIPTSWYLTSIQSPNGYGITLTYTRGKFYITSETLVKGKTILPGGWAGVGENIPTAKLIKSTMYHPCYLDKITTPVTSVKFNWSNANSQLGYTFEPENPPFESHSTWTAPDPYSEMYFARYAQVKDAVVVNRFPNKIDNFIVEDIGSATFKKVIEFGYTDQTNTRLKLTSVKIKNSLGSSSTVYSQYGFQYNSTALPEYHSFKTDGYGFYNGSNPYMTSDDPSYYTSLFANSTSRQNYIDSRAPNATYTNAEILKRITYPTGGYTEFEFENNVYGSIATFWPAAVTTNVDDLAKMTSGLRIKKIKNYDYDDRVIGEKHYYYVKDYSTGGTKSSGVLNYQPVFYRYFNGSVTTPAKWIGTPSASTYTGTMTFTQFDTNPLNTPNNNSSHITYSEVTEVNLDGSYTVMKYKNYDNGFHDNPAENSVCDNSNIDGGFWKEDQMNSLELERGQLVSETMYNASNLPKRITTYTYDDNTSRFQNNVRRIKLIPNPIFSPNYLSLRYTATLVYTYYPFLKSKTIENIENESSLITSEQYTYSDLRLLSSITTSNSKKEPIVITNKYPYDFPGDLVLQAMTNSHIVSPVIERTTTKNGLPLSQTTVPYQSFTFGPSTRYLPQKLQLKVKANAIEDKYVYTHYDNIGNILEQQKSDDIKQSFIWDETGVYPIAEATNAVVSDIAYTSFEDNNKGGWNNYTGTITKVVSSPLPPTGDKYYSLTATETLSKTVTNSKKYIVSYWRNNTSPFTILGGTSTNIVGKTIGSWTCHIHKVTASSTTLTISGVGGIDEVRIYPDNAQMSTYTYNPIVGRTSYTDFNNRITYYEYDGIGRLILTRDQDKNILDRYCYNLKGQAENCALFGNQSQSGSFTPVCTNPCEVSPAVTYTVPAYAYYAATQTEANTLAINDVAANGQTYANTKANCASLDNTTIYASNTTSSSVVVIFTRLCDNTGYTFNVGDNIGGTTESGGVTLGSIPLGTYRISFSRSTGSGTHRYRLNSTSTTGTDYAELSSVEVYASPNNRIMITPP